MLKIGENALKFFDNFINHSNNKKYDYRSISGILSLRTKYDDEMIDKACERANTYGAFSYKIIKRICEKGIIDFPTQTNITYINKNKTNITRDLAEYDKLANLEDFKYE